MNDLTKKLTKNDYKILTVMYRNGALSKIRANTIKTLAEDSKLSTYKIRESIKIFIILNLVEEGIRCGTAKSYFLTELGQSETQSILNDVKTQAKTTCKHNNNNNNNNEVEA